MIGLSRISDVGLLSGVRETSRKPVDRMLSSLLPLRNIIFIVEVSMGSSSVSFESSKRCFMNSTIPSVRTWVISFQSIILIPNIIYIYLFKLPPSVTRASFRFQYRLGGRAGLREMDKSPRTISSTYAEWATFIKSH
jgi:hypothetical protein